MSERKIKCWTCIAEANRLCSMCDAWYCDACASEHIHPPPLEKMTIEERLQVLERMLGLRS